MCGRGDAVSLYVISDYRRLVKDPTETVERKNLTLVSEVYNCRGGLKATKSRGYKTVTIKGNLLRRVTIERLSPVRTRPYIALCFICTCSRQATIVWPLKWNMLRPFHRHN
jgi:hypothetical protein